MRHLPEAQRYAWTRSGPQQVAPGVHRAPLPLPGDALRAVNVYVVEDGDGLVLVDAGADKPESRTALDAALSNLGRDISEVTCVLATHVHFDHYGQASDIRRRTGARTLLPADDELSLRVATDRPTWDASLADRRRWMAGYGAEAVADRFEEESLNWELEAIDAPGTWEAPDRFLVAGEIIELKERTLEVIATPGHTRGHVSFLDRQSGLLFAGDHVLPHITPSIGFEPFADGLALERFLDSLRAVRCLDVTRVLPGHGPVFDDLAERVDELLEHHRQRLDACMEFVRHHGSALAIEVARHLRWTRRDRHFDELDALNQLLAVSETIAHLELLIHQGRLARPAGHPSIAMPAHVTAVERGRPAA